MQPATSVEKGRAILSEKPTHHFAREWSGAVETVANVYDGWDWEVLYHPSYSSDLSLCDIDLIPKMKEPVYVIHFRTVIEIH